MKRIKSDTAVCSVPYPGGTAQFARKGDTLTITLSYRGAYGMGEKYDRLNQKGHTVVNQVEEKFCFQGEKTYCAAPFFWTDTGFGLYVDTSCTTSFSFEETGVTVKLPEEADVVAFSGTPETILREYQNLFGAPVLPPEWAFGVWISANRWNTQKDAELQIARLKEYGFPASVLVLEAWSDEATFYVWNGARYTPSPAPKRCEDFDFSGSPWPDPQKMIDRLHEAGLHLLLWQVPVYKKLSAGEAENPQNELDGKEAAKNGFCVKLADGSPYTIPAGHWFSGSMIPDFTNLSAREDWFGKRCYLLDMGVDGFKTDGGEFLYREDTRFCDGTTGREGKNRYARDYTQSYRDFIGPKRVLFSRAGFAGQHTVPIHWAGDQQSQNREFKSALRAGLSAAASGILFWGFDIAGFAGPLPTLDLYRRATQTACFCPIMQWHSEPDGGQFRELLPGGQGNNERSPWNMAQTYHEPEFLSEMRFWHQLRERLRPYLWNTAQRCVREGKPMMRPLFYEWPDEALFQDCEDEYLLGDALLIAPLMEENARTRAVRLPKGKWHGFFDGRVWEGGREIEAGGSGKLPVFIRDGFEGLFENI